MSYLEKAVELSTASENCEGDNWTDLVNLCGDADKQISQLKAKLDKYRFIPVSERLPDRRGLYLILWHNVNDGNMQLRDSKEYIFDKNDDWGFTHWKPVIKP